MSDVHCDGPDSPTQAAFLRFLAAHPGVPVVLAGDIFHAFAAPSGVPFPAYQPVIDALAGRTLAVLPGNHDWALAAWLGGAGVAVGTRLRRALGALQADLSHGDEVDGSTRYRAFHRFLRGRGFARTLDALGPDGAWALLHRLAGPLGEGAPNPALVAAQRQLAAERLAAGADLVVMGHTHHPELTRLGGGWFLNPGDWVTHRTYGVVTGAEVELRRFVG